MLAQVITTALLAAQAASGAVIRHYDGLENNIIASTITVTTTEVITAPVVPATTTHALQSTVFVTITDYTTVYPSAHQPSPSPESYLTYGTGGASFPNFTGTAAPSPSNPGFVGAPGASSGFGYFSWDGYTTSSSDSKQSTSAPASSRAGSTNSSMKFSPGSGFVYPTPSGARPSSPGSTLPLSAPVRPTAAPSFGLASFSSSMPAKSAPAPVHSNASPLPPANDPLSQAPSMAPSPPTSLAPTQPSPLPASPAITPPHDQSSTAVVVQPVPRPSSTAIVVVPVHPPAIRAQDESFDAEDKVDEIQVDDVDIREVVSQSCSSETSVTPLKQVVDGPGKNTITVEIVQTVNSLGSSSMPRPQQSLYTSSEPTPTPVSSFTTSALSGATKVISHGKHCPYPYPNEHCGQPITTEVSGSTGPQDTKTANSEKLKATGWCPYPGQKC